MHGSLKLTLAALLAFASSASASCFEAVRYGDSVATPSKSGPLKYGDTVKVTTNYTCAVQYYGYVPAFTEYVLSPTNDSDHVRASNYFLARHDNPPLLDTITLKIPDGYFLQYAAYVLEVLITYPQKGPNNGTANANRAGQELPINLAITGYN